MNDDFVKAHAGAIEVSNSDHFKKLAYRLLSDFAESTGRRMSEEEHNAMVRWLATEALSLGAFAYGRAGGDLEAALAHVRAEFLRGNRSNVGEGPAVVEVTTQS